MNLAKVLISCVILNKLFKFSEPHHLENVDSKYRIFVRVKKENQVLCIVLALSIFSIKKEFSIVVLSVTKIWAFLNSFIEICFTSNKCH